MTGQILPSRHDALVSVAQAIGQVVYFAVSKDGLVKIGTTSDLKSRSAAIGYHGHGEVTLFRVIPGGFDVERLAHDAFESNRVCGEWYTFAPEMLSFRASIRPSETATGEPELFAISDGSVRGVVSAIGLDRTQEVLGVGYKSVNRAMCQNRFPASWYKVLKSECGRIGIDCPDDVFSFKPERAAS